MPNAKLVMCEKCQGTGYVNGGNESSTWSKTCEDCHGVGFFRAPTTNADRIRAMSGDELAKLLLEGCRGSKCEDQPQNEFGSVDCFECRMKWLKQPAE